HAPQLNKIYHPILSMMYLEQCQVKMSANVELFSGIAWTSRSCRYRDLALRQITLLTEKYHSFQRHE
ncbi:MAG: hypothetical protein KDD53_12765, partial [Bdellovibrionales bacterium]|nr:hypothetical protein [Bdellovibrionales bacterium]